MKDLVALVGQESTPRGVIVDGLLELIYARRKSGASLYDVTVTLIELLQRAHPTHDDAFDDARRLAHLPPNADLTPGTGPLSFASALSRSSSSSRTAMAARNQVVAVLARCPDEVAVGHAREVLLEWAFALEAKILGHSGGGGGGEAGSSSGVGGSEGGSVGRGGKGSIGSAGFEEITARFRDVRAELVDPPPEVAAVLLAIRLQLGYLSFAELEHELGTLSLDDAERVLRQWVKRRLAGDGRHAIGRWLDKLEIDVSRTRPALKSVIRMVKRKFLLPIHPHAHPTQIVPLPAPGKSRCIALLQTFAAAVNAPPGSFGASASSPTTPTTPSAFSFARDPPPYASSSQSKSPVSTSSPLSRGARAGDSSASDNIRDEKALAAYALELLSEFVTREKREYMRSEKWIKSGRKTLSKELNEIEEKLCFSYTPSTSAGSPAGSSSAPGGRARRTKSGAALAANPCLLPIFEVVRRTFNLEPPIGQSAILSGANLGTIAVPDEDESYFPPTPQSVTSALYCNPRLDTEPAVDIILELVDYEKDLRVHAVTSMLSRRSTDASASEELDDAEGMISLAWGTIEKTKMAKVLQSIERRFPEGEYNDAFRAVELRTDCPPKAMNRAPSYTTVASAKTAARTANYMGTAMSLTSTTDVPMSPRAISAPLEEAPSETNAPQSISPPLVAPPLIPSSAPPPARRPNVLEQIAESGTEAAPVPTSTRSVPASPQRQSIPRSSTLPSLDTQGLGMETASQPSTSNPLTPESVEGVAGMPSPPADASTPAASAPFHPTDLNRDYEAHIRPLYSPASSTGSNAMPAFPLSAPTRLPTGGSASRPTTAPQTATSPPKVSRAMDFVKRRPSLFNRISSGGSSSSADGSSARSRGTPRSSSFSGNALLSGQNAPVMPVPAPGHSSRAAANATSPATSVSPPSISPSGWRQQFMASNMLQPANRASTITQAAASTSRDSSPFRQAGSVSRR